MTAETAARKEWQEPIMKIADAIDELVLAAVRAEREACAKLVHDRLGADGYGVAQMIRARSNNSN